MKDDQNLESSTVQPAKECKLWYIKILCRVCGVQEEGASIVDFEIEVIIGPAT